MFRVTREDTDRKSQNGKQEKIMEKDCISENREE